ncbi:N-acylethanolamine-hydrolyzing acid amidase-like [Actinia tenebrosa]|uniref:N-acylethanolamine-hydrolyzing acid amidase n=1 Tax=Actinia tenebrosa TaxID=6105 RepID=A0A6P8I7U0_ACTTE|nr:N-acylethanolamine-hydrolyzing acid amidase-like [Actinia tenebrosa]
MILLSLIVVFLGISYSSSEPVQAKRFTVNLDLPPQERWVKIMQEYRQYTPTIIKDVQNFFPKPLLPLIDRLALYLDKYFPAPYPDELRGIASGLNISLSNAVLLNLVYDFSAFCTSIVAQDTQGNIYHARNLDYHFTADLRKLTFMVDFRSKGKTVYSGVVFAGMIGLVTAQRPKAVTITLNERDQGFLWENLIMAILRKEAIPVLLEIRQITATENMNFSQAVTLLSKVPMIADAYLIVGGINPGEGAVITRDRTAVANLWKLDPPTRWFLVETNYDHWTTPPPSDDRRDPAIKAMNETGQENVNGAALFKVLSIHPVLNKKTVYTAVMSAKNNGLFNAWVQQP